jgi:hypothetical protein
VAALPGKYAAECADLISSIFDKRTTVIPNFLNLTMTPSNPILHTTRLRTLFRDWHVGVVYDSVPLFYEEWDDPQNNILWKTTGFRAIIYALPSLCNKGIRNKMLTQDFFKSCFSIFKTYLNHHSLSLTSNDFPGGGEQNQKKLAKIIVESIADNDITQYKAHLVKAKNIQDFIDNIIDINKYELYDLAKALDNYTAASYGTLQIKDKDNAISIVYPNTDISIEVPKERSREYLEYIENKYMSGMGYESWFSYNESLEKDN